MCWSNNLIESMLQYDIIDKCYYILTLWKQNSGKISIKWNPMNQYEYYHVAFSDKDYFHCLK